VLVLGLGYLELVKLPKGGLRAWPFWKDANRYSQAGLRPRAEFCRLLWRCQMMTTSGTHSKGLGAGGAVALPVLYALPSCMQ